MTFGELKASVVGLSIDQMLEIKDAIDASILASGPSGRKRLAARLDKRLGMIGSTSSAALNEDEKEAARILGLSEEEFAKHCRQMTCDEYVAAHKA